MALSVTTWSIVPSRQVLRGANQHEHIELRAKLPDQAQKANLICPNGYIAEVMPGRRLINHSASAVKSHVLNTTGFIVSELTSIDPAAAPTGSHLSASCGKLAAMTSLSEASQQTNDECQRRGRLQSSCANAICFEHEKWIRWRAQTFWRIPNSIAQCKWSMWPNTGEQRFHLWT